MQFNEVRVYAKAIFSLAKESGRCVEWGHFLSTSSTAFAAFPDRRILLAPQILLADKVRLLSDEATSFDEGENFLRILLSKKKIALLPAIASDYQKLLHVHSNILEIKVVSAKELSEYQRQSFIEALKKRHDCDIVLRCEVDASLVGGAVLYMANKVLDHSLRGMLENLKKSLCLKSAYARA